MFPTPRVVQFKDSALMLAIYKENDAMATALLNHNANPDIQSAVCLPPSSPSTHTTFVSLWCVPQCWRMMVTMMGLVIVVIVVMMVILW